MAQQGSRGGSFGCPRLSLHQRVATPDPFSDSQILGYPEPRLLCWTKSHDQQPGRANVEHVEQLKQGAPSP